ncbi:hypothetical protein D9611_013467 [Ephemerocybe angulata]|uniref:F-box domain-containing protein n=1 Tax=Ephemerocybe angulata TaxID=980116 RepID=A0A8H5FA04_9AGAR|nr:hypothetical protein D9611_013467 [Tulosesus angulatus]
MLLKPSRWPIEIMRLRRVHQSYPYRQELEWCHFCRERHTPPEAAPVFRLPLDLGLRIVSFLPFSDRCALNASCRHLEKFVTNPVAARVRHTLREFGLDPGPFLESMQYHGAVIGGIAALRIFVEDVPMPRVLEVYTRQGHPDLGAPNQEEYDDDDPSADRGNGYRLVETAIFTYGKCQLLGYQHYGANVEKILRMRNSTLDREILFVQSRVPPIELIIEAPTTLLMNFITSNDAVCLYPDLTERRKGLLTLPIPDDRSSTLDVPVLDTLAGFRLYMFGNATQAVGRHRCPLHPSCPAVPRAYPDLLMYTVRFTDAGGYGSRLAESTWTLKVPSPCGSTERIEQRIGGPINWP